MSCYIKAEVSKIGGWEGKTERGNASSNVMDENLKNNGDFNKQKHAEVWRELDWFILRIPGAVKHFKPSKNKML